MASGLLRGNPVTSISELYALQELDLAIAADRAAIADLDSRTDEPEELVEARETFRTSQETLRAAEHKFKESEFEADELRRKIDPLEQKLYKGAVTAPKELEDLQADIDSLKRRRSTLEDQALAAMDALESAQQQFTDAEQRVHTLAEQYGVEREDMGVRRQEIDAEIARLGQEREEAAAEIDPALMALYEKLRANKGGRAVAKLEGGACQGCRISLPMNVQQRARAGATVVQCPSCERILYMI